MNPAKKRRIMKLVAFVFPVMVILFAVMVWAVASLWNWLMPEIFGLQTITYWQAMGLMALSWLLFRGFRGPSFGRGGWPYGMRGRWQSMSPAEREEFVKGLNSRWGGPPPPQPEPKA